MRGRASAWRVRKQCGERRQGQSVILKSDFKQPERNANRLRGGEAGKDGHEEESRGSCRAGEVEVG